MSHGGHGGSHRMPKGPLIPNGFGVLTGKEIDAALPPGFMTWPVTWPPAFVEVDGDDP